MKNYKNGSINSIETLGLVDGPGIRVVVFFNGCKLRCKYCHNPEMWKLQENNYSSFELVEKLLRYKPYFKNGGGITFSGGEPLLQKDFLIEVCKELKKENIHIALDTAGVGLGQYEDLLKYIDLILFDVKDSSSNGFTKLTGYNPKETFEFLKSANKLKKKFWVRQVIIPDQNDNLDYLKSLKEYINLYIKNVEKVEFLPFHRLGEEKYQKLNIDYPYKFKNNMDKDKCNELLEAFLKM